MSAFNAWRVSGSHFRSFGVSWDVILASWGLILVLFQLLIWLPISSPSGGLSLISGTLNLHICRLVLF